MNYPQGIPLTGYNRGKTPIDEIIYHESVTWTRDECVNVLKGRKLGVHFTVDRDGSVQQHLPLQDAGAHAEGFGKPSLHNERSIAIEVINRYYGSYATPQHEVIDCVWAHLGKYIVPTPTQLESVWILTEELCQGYGIPMVFPGTKKSLIGVPKFYWGRVAKHEVPGLFAHHRWAHADALFVEHYCWLRSNGFPPDLAFEHTKTSATQGRWTGLPNKPSLAK